MELRERREKLLPLVGAALALVVVLLAAQSISSLGSIKNLAAVNSAEVFALTNEERADGGIATLQRNSLLDQAAQMKAQDMAAKGYYAHVSPEGLTPMYWVERAGYKYLVIGENLVVNRTDADQVVDAFMGSPGHRANILRKDFTDIGVGVANGTYKGKNATFTVQIFAAPYPSAASAKPKTAKAAVKPTQAAPAKETSAPAAVPRSAVATTSNPVPREVPVRSVQSQQLAKSVAQLISPIVSSFESTTTASVTVPVSEDVFPSRTLLDVPVPVDLDSVSQLGSKELPPQIGSSWSMQLRLIVSNWYERARTVFGG